MPFLTLDWGAAARVTADFSHTLRKRDGLTGFWGVKG